MGLGSTIVRSIMSGAIQAAKDVAREEARSNPGKQQSQQVHDVTLTATSYLAAPSTTTSLGKALRVAGIVDGLLEQTRNEWLPIFRASFSEGSPASEKVQQNVDDSINTLYAHLKDKGFPCDTDVTFWTTVSDIQFELMLHKAFPDAWENWNEELDNMLERAASAAKRLAGEHRMETVAKLTPDGHLPNDSTVLNERLMRAVRELLAQVVLPSLVSAGMVLENDPVYMARFGHLIPKVVLSDMVEFSAKLATSGTSRKE
jgi:hypothetical protein